MPSERVTRPTRQRHRPREDSVFHSLIEPTSQYSTQYSVHASATQAWYAFEWLSRKLSNESVSGRKAAVSRYSSMWKMMSSPRYTANGDDDGARMSSTAVTFVATPSRKPVSVAVPRPFGSVNSRHASGFLRDASTVAAESSGALVGDVRSITLASNKLS